MGESAVCQQGRRQGSAGQDPGPGKAGHILESKPVSGIAIPPLLVELVWMCLSNVCGRQTQTFKIVHASHSLYTFFLIKLSFGSQSSLIVLTQHINSNTYSSVQGHEWKRRVSHKGTFCCLPVKEVPLVPTDKECLV